MNYAVVYTPTDTGWSASVPDLAGCVVEGDTRDETEELILGAVAVHVAFLREFGMSPPLPGGELPAAPSLELGLIEVL